MIFRIFNYGSVEFFSATKEERYCRSELDLILNGDVCIIVLELKKDGKSWISQKDIKEKERQEALKATAKTEAKRKQQELNRLKVRTSYECSVYSTWSISCYISQFKMLVFIAGGCVQYRPLISGIRKFSFKRE